MSVTQGQVNFATSPLISQWEKIKDAFFGRKPFEALSNIDLQVELTPLV